MKRCELVQIADYLKKFKKIDAIYRVDNTVIKIVFDKKETIFFDMLRGNSAIFKSDDFKSAKKFEAPFDIVLKKRINSSLIKEIKVLDNDKVIRFEVEQKKSYKSTKSFIQFEFTGRHTNSIITDENFIILEALRHIDKSVSFRMIQNGLTLPPLPKFECLQSDICINNMEKYLTNIYKQREEKRVFQAINQKLILINKRKKKIIKLLNNLEEPEKLLQKTMKYQKQAELILANLHKIKNYQKSIELVDYENKNIKIQLPQNAKNPAMAADMLFKLAKKMKKKAINVHIEKENLESKIKFLNNLENSIKDVKSINELKLYFPQKQKRDKKDKQTDGVENFFYRGYKISLGRNEKGNIFLLKNSKMSDIWLHLKDIPSTHVIIKSDKKEIPFDVLQFGAKLCVRFSTTQKGSFLVDFTKRRNVKIIHGARVNYTNYDTIKINI